MIDSRVRPTEVLGQAIAGCRRPPRVWLQASTATIYAHRYDADNDEATGILGGHEPSAPDTWRFSIEVAKAWEAAANRAATPHTRQGAAAQRHDHEPRPGRSVRHAAGPGAPRAGRDDGDGRQYMSWIHEDELCSCDWKVLIAHNFCREPIVDHLHSIYTLSKCPVFEEENLPVAEK